MMNPSMGWILQFHLKMREKLFHLHLKTKRKILQTQAIKALQIQTTIRFRTMKIRRLVRMFIRRKPIMTCIMTNNLLQGRMIRNPFQIAYTINILENCNAGISNKIVLSYPEITH